TMHIPLIRGRYFDDHDNDMNSAVVIVDERLAQRFWPGKDPIGKRMYHPNNPRELLRADEHTQWLTVVGVVREVQLQHLAGRPGSVGAYYFPASQATPATRTVTIAIRTAIDPSAIMRSVRAELKKLDSEMPLANVRTMDEYVTQSLLSRKA